MPLFCALAALWAGWSVWRNVQIAKPFLSSITALADLPSAIPAAITHGLWLRLLIVTAFWLLSSGIGRIILHPLRLEPFGLEGKLVNSAAGALILSLTLLALAATGLWSVNVLRGTFAAALALGLIGHKLPAAPPHPSPPAERLSALDRIAGILLVAAVGAAILTTSAPETFYDSLVYHLALPKLYLLNGGLIQTPHNVFSGAPQGAQMLYGLMLGMGDSRLTALLHLSFGIGTALTLWMSCRAYANSSAGILASLLFFCCPVVLYAGGFSGVDLFSAFFISVAFHAILRSLDAPQSREWAICGGVALGAALSTKYNVFSVGLALVFTHAIIAYRRSQPLTNSFIIGVLSLAFLTPWLAKNLVFFNKPFYPFLAGQPVPDWAGFLSAAESQNIRTTLTTVAGLTGLVSLPWRFSLGHVAMDNWPGAAFLLLAPWLLVRGEDGAHRPAILATVLGYLSWCIPSTQGRFLIPVLPILAFAMATIVHRTRVPAWLRNGAMIGTLITACVNLAAASHQNRLNTRWPFLQGQLDSASFLKMENASYPVPAYSAIEFINRNLAADSIVLFVGEARAFHSDRRFIAPTVFDDNMLWKATRESVDASEIRNRLAGLGITHILLNGRGLYMGAPHTNLPSDLVKSRRFNEFMMYFLKPVFEDVDSTRGPARWLYVYEIQSVRSSHPLQRFNIPLSVLEGMEGRR